MKISVCKACLKYDAGAVRISRFLSGVVGLVLLLAAVLKSTDLALFARQIKAYGIIQQPMLLTVSAWGMNLIQFMLGAALLFYYRPTRSLTLSIGLWLMLLGVTVWAMLTGITDQCGCYGSWMIHTPTTAAAENLILLFITILAWIYRPVVRIPVTRGQVWAFRSACIAGLAFPFVFNMSSSTVKASPTNLHANVIIMGQGSGPIELHKGIHLVALIGTDCAHCLDAIPELERLAESDDLPEVVALCPNDEEERKRFVETFEPGFPIGRINEDTFWRLLGTGDLPLVLLIRNGTTLHAWDREIPDKDQVKQQMNPPPDR